MNGVSHTDLFATKGIEYIVVIGFLALLAVAWHLIRSPADAGADGRRLDWRSILRGVGLPETDFLFHPGHAWARLSSDEEVAVVGWDDFARRLIGPADGFRLPEPGTRLTAGAPVMPLGLTWGSTYSRRSRVWLATRRPSPNRPHQVRLRPGKNSLAMNWPQP
jgi:glycine cleavage system H protein